MACQKHENLLELSMLNVYVYQSLMFIVNLCNFLKINIISNFLKTNRAFKCLQIKPSKAQIVCDFISGSEFWVFIGYHLALISTRV